MWLRDGSGDGNGEGIALRWVLMCESDGPFAGMMTTVGRTYGVSDWMGVGFQDGHPGGKMDKDGTWDDDPYRYGDTGPLTAAGLRAVSRSWAIVPPY